MDAFQRQLELLRAMLDRPIQFPSYSAQGGLPPPPPSLTSTMPPGPAGVPPSPALRLNDLPAIGQLDQPDLLPPFARAPTPPGQGMYGTAKAERLSGLPPTYRGPPVENVPAGNERIGAEPETAFGKMSPDQLAGAIKQSLPPPIDPGVGPNPPRPSGLIPPQEPPLASTQADIDRARDFRQFASPASQAQIDRIKADFELARQSQPRMPTAGQPPLSGNGMLAPGGMPPMPPPRPGIPLPPQRPPEFGQSPGGMMPGAPGMPGGGFSTMLDIARGGPGMGGMGAGPPQPPQQPFGQNDLVSKMERPLGGILDKGWMGGDPKMAAMGGILGGGGMPPPWLFGDLFGGGFGGGFGGF